MRSRARDTIAPFMIAAAAVVTACGGAPAPATPPRTAPGGAPFTRTAATLAAGACSQLQDRLFSLATAADGVNDLFVLVKTCTAHAERDDVVLATDAYAWLAVDRSLGAVSVREFVHVTLGAQVRLGTRIAYAGDHAEVTLTRAGARITIEPVGILEGEALNWASLLALELAPSAGASAEAIAKRKLQEEAEAALLKALAEPIVVSYEGRTGETWFGGAATRGASRSRAVMRVVRRGMALSRPIEPTAATLSARVHVMPGGGHVAVRAVCRSSAERMLDADRRGEPVFLDDWTSVEADATVPVPPMPCAWIIAVRAQDDRASLVTIDAPEPRASITARRADRWVSFDLVRADLHEDFVGPLSIELGGGAWHHTLTAKSPSLAATIVVLSPGEGVTVRALRPGAGGGLTAVAATVRLPVDDAGDVDRTIPIVDAAGVELATLKLRARVRTQGGP